MNGFIRYDNNLSKFLYAYMNFSYVPNIFIELPLTVVKIDEPF